MEEAANWAHRVMASKNTLIEADAALIEQAFQAKLGNFVGGPLDQIRSPQAAEWRPMKRERKRRRSTVIDKAVLALPAPRRIRDREHVKSVAKQSCLVCGRRPADAHHLRFAQSRALGSKVSCRVRPLLFATANQPNFALDRLSRYEATLWRQAGRILYALKTIPDVEVATYLHQSWPALVDDLNRQPTGTHTLIIGYSLGANNAVLVANRVSHVDSIIALQPSMFASNPNVTGNVGRIIEIYNPNPWMTFGGMGSQKLVGPNVEYIVTNDTHPGAQFNSEFRILVKSEGKAQSQAVQAQRF